MQKIFYCIGIYATCVFVHDCATILAKKIEEHENNEKHHKKGAIGIQPNPAKKPMNKIGFEIPQD